MRQKIDLRPGDARAVYLKRAIPAIPAGDPDAPEVLP